MAENIDEDEGDTASSKEQGNASLLDASPFLSPRASVEKVQQKKGKRPQSVDSERYAPRTLKAKADKPLPCPHCSKVFKGKKCFEKHLAIHLRSPSKCDQCEHVSYSPAAAKLHRTEAHQDISTKKMYRCGCCNAINANKAKCGIKHVCLISICTGGVHDAKMSTADPDTSEAEMSSKNIPVPPPPPPPSFDENEDAAAGLMEVIDCMAQDDGDDGCAELDLGAIDDKTSRQSDFLASDADHDFMDDDFEAVKSDAPNSASTSETPLSFTPRAEVGSKAYNEILHRFMRDGGSNFTSLPMYLAEMSKASGATTLGSTGDYDDIVELTSSAAKRKKDKEKGKAKAMKAVYKKRSPCALLSLF